MIKEGDKFTNGTNLSYSVKKVKEEYFGMHCDLYDENGSYLITSIAFSTLEQLVDEGSFHYIPTMILYKIKKHKI